MPISRVDYGGNTLIDITDSTVTEAMVLSGCVFYNAKGERKVGTLEAYSVTYNLTDVISSSTVQVIPFGGSFNTVLSTDSSHIVSEVTVLMGGADVTSNVYNPTTNAIDIPVVNGSISIHAVQAEKPVSVFNPSWLVFGYWSNAWRITFKWSLMDTILAEFPETLCAVFSKVSDYWSSGGGSITLACTGHTATITKKNSTLSVGGVKYAVITITKENFMTAYESLAPYIESEGAAWSDKTFQVNNTSYSRIPADSTYYFADGAVTKDNVVELTQQAEGG